MSKTNIPAHAGEAQGPGGHLRRSDPGYHAVGRVAQQVLALRAAHRPVVARAAVTGSYHHRPEAQAGPQLLQHANNAYVQAHHPAAASSGNSPSVKCGLRRRPGRAGCGSSSPRACRVGCPTLTSGPRPGQADG